MLRNTRFIFLIFLSLVQFQVNRALACSIIYEPRPYSEEIDELRRQKLTDLIENASTILLAKVTAHSKANEFLSSDRLLVPTLYEFAVIEVLKGKDIKGFPYISKDGVDNYVALPLYDSDGIVIVEAENAVVVDSDAFWEDRHSSYSFWSRANPLIGEMISPGDCRDYVYFKPDATYLFMLDAAQKTISAERIPTNNDLWLAGVRRALSSEGTFGEITIENIFKDMRPIVERITVTRCGRSPKIVREDLLFNTEEEETPRRAFWFKSGGDPYIEYPFERSTCKRGAVYLTLDYLQWFFVETNGAIDFEDIALELELFGPTIIGLNQVIEWVATTRISE